MKNTARYRYRTMLCLFLTLFMLIPASAAAQDGAALRHRIDSLRHLLTIVQGEERKGIYEKLTFDYLSLNDAEEGLAFFREYLAEARRLKDPLVEGKVLAARMNLFHNSDLFDSIRLQHPQVLELLERNGQWGQFFSVCMQWSRSLMMRGKAEEALAESERIYRKAKELGNQFGLGVALINMGHAYGALARMDDARDSFRQAVEVLEKAGQPRTLFEAYEMLVSMHNQNGEYEEALAVCRKYEQALNEASRASDKPEEYDVSRFNLYCAQADIYSFLDRYDDSEAALRLAERNPIAHNERSKNKIRFARAQNYYMTGHYEETVRILDTLCKSLAGYGDLRAANIMLGDKARVAYEGGMYKISAESYRDFIGQNDSLRTVANEARLEELRTQYEVDKITAQKEANRNYMLLALGGCVFLLAALAVWIVYSRRLAAKNRGLVQRIREQDRMEEEYARMLAALKPGETRQGEDERQDALFTALRDMMKEEKPYTDSELTRRAVADRLRTNETYLHETIRKHTGFTFNEYINSLRLFHAREMLADAKERYTVEAVAIDSGFGTRQTFYRLFRANYGLTPEEFRKLSAM